MMRVTPPLGWAVLMVFAVTIFGGLVWSLFASAPVKLAGRGILQTGGGIALIDAPGEGMVASLLPAIGQRVRPGALLATIAQPELDARAHTLQRKVVMLQAERVRLAAFSDRVEQSRHEADNQQRGGIAERLAALREREAALAETLESQRRLRERGFVTRDRILAIQTELASTRQAIAAARDEASAVSVNAGARRTAMQREVLDADDRIDAARQELAEAMTDLADRSEVRAPSGGRILELSSAVGDRVVRGTPLMRLARDGGEGLTASLYIAAGNGKRIRPGMAVQIVPSSVQLEREGFIKGEVMSISEVPVTREAAQRTLKNDALVQTLFNGGPPFELRIRLERDPRTASGFAWSSTRGGEKAVETGTIIDGYIVAERIPIIVLLFPEADRLLHWLRIA